MKIRKALAGLGIAAALATGFTVAPLATAELGVGDVQRAEAYTAYSCHYHYSSFYGNERFCYIDWTWWEEVTSTRTDGWHVYFGGKWLKTYSSHNHYWA